MDFTWIDLLKIMITVVSCFSLWYFRRGIVKVITDIMIGGDSSKYNGRNVSDILEDVDTRLNEVLK